MTDTEINNLQLEEKAAEKRVEQERQTRMLLRVVDDYLKTEGPAAALVELTHVQLVVPITPVTSVWLRTYRDMLLLWQAGYMPMVQKVFNQYGFRRARDIAQKQSYQDTRERMQAQYANCAQVLAEIANRSRLAVTDTEKLPIHIPKVLALDDVDVCELEEGEKL